MFSRAWGRVRVSARKTSTTSGAARRDRVQQLTLAQFSTMVQMPCVYCGRGANNRNASVVGIERERIVPAEVRSISFHVPLHESVAGAACLSEQSSSKCHMVDGRAV